VNGGSRGIEAQGGLLRECRDSQLQRKHRNAQV
jgi:hypothetical protein